MDQLLEAVLVVLFAMVGAAIGFIESLHVRHGKGQEVVSHDLASESGRRRYA